jgi:arylformamidase
MLSAMALTGYGATDRMPARFVRAATLMSGSYFMEPVVLSTRGSYVQLSPQEVLELSPGLMAERLQCPALLVYAEHDTDEFQRQSREFAARLERARLLQRLVCLRGLNHFEVVEKLADPAHELFAAIMRQIDLEPHFPRADS